MECLLCGSLLRDNTVPPYRWLSVALQRQQLDVQVERHQALHETARLGKEREAMEVTR